MAIKGEFTADFSSFTAAVDAADVKLQGFQANSNVVQSSLNRMANALQGNKLMQDATLMAEAVERIGGVAKLTETELTRLGAQATEAIEKMHAAGKQVPPNLQAIADEAKNVKGAWGELVAGFNIQDAVTHPLDTAKQGVMALAESMGPLGVAVAGATGVVTGLGVAVYQLTVHSAEVGARFQDISEKTGMSVPAVSRLSVAMQAMGGDMGTVSNAVFKLGQGIAQGSEEMEKGLGRLGLSVDAVKATRIDDWLAVVAEHFAATGSQAQRNAALVEMWGKQGRDLGPVLLKLNEALQQTASITPWTEAQAAAAEKLELQLGTIKVKAEAVAIAFGSVFIGPISTAIEWVSKLGNAYDDVDKKTHGWLSTAINLTNSGNLIGQAYDTATAGVSTFVTGVGDLPPVAKMSTAELDHMSQSLKNLEIQPKTLSIQGQTKAIDELNAQYQKIIAAAEHWAGVMAELNTAGGNVQATIDTIDGTIVEALKYYLAAGVSQHTLAEAYALTATQVKAVDTAMKAELETAKVLSDFVSKSHEMAMKRSNDEIAANNKRAQAVDAAVIKEVNAQGQLNAAYKAQETPIEVLNQKLDQLHAQKVEGISQSAQEQLLMDEYQKKLYDEALAQDRANAERAKKIQDLEKEKQKYEEVTTAMETYQGGIKLPGSSTETAFGQNYLTSPSGARVPLGPHGELPDNWYELYSGKSSFSQTINSLPRFAGGGSMSAGMAAIVGERGPELFVPTSAGAIVPQGMGGTSITQVFHITAPLGSPDAIARAVADAQVGLMRGQGVRLPYGT
jgi:hypothetical protein